MVFEVGDEVQVIVSKPRYGWGPIDPGDIGIIVEIFENPKKHLKSVYIDFPEKHSSWHGLISEIDFADSECSEKKLPVRYQEII